MSGIPAGAGSLLGKRLGKYEILALLALGGTAEIYLARIGGAAGFEKYVVIKCLHDHLADDPDFVKMFLDEARLAAMLDHSNIVQTFELGEHEDRYYMVMEFLAGLSLAMVVRRAAERLPGGRVPVPLVLNMAAQASGGMHYAHERTLSGKPLNMVHRDISPQNLVVSFEGLVKIVDFGIARADQRDTKTKAGTIKGKFAYMSPEQCVATNVDRRTDVFALGVIVHELLTGRRLFKRNSAYETYQAVMECVVPPPSSVNHELDPTLDQIVLKACAKEPGRRYPTAEAFGDALLGYLHHRGKGTGPADVQRFLDEHFMQEIDEHGERMRELISNRDFAVDSAVSWGEDDKAHETVDLHGRDIVEVRPSEASLESMVARLPTNDPNHGRDDDDESGGGDDEIPAERTRIEANPLDKVRELHEEMKRVDSRPIPTGSVIGPAPLPAPPTVAQPKHTIGAAQSGRFPDLANLPTQIADAQTPPAAAFPTPRPGEVSIPPELANTKIAGAHGNIPHPDDPPLETPTNPRQVYAGIEPELPRPPVVASVSANNSAHGSGPIPQIGPMSATQAAVRVSQLQNAQAGSAASVDPSLSPYPVVSGRPSSTDLAPSNMPHRPSFRNDHAAGSHSMPSHPSQPGQAPQAASLMSPVGDHYAANVDWAAAAARSAKPVPRWLFGVFFAGALFVALMITMIVAKIIR